MTKKEPIPFQGYIEGYYGRLLSWEDRDRLIINLRKNKMHYYFYAPKEDLYHRFNWKINYDKNWEIEFKKFCLKAKSNNIKVIIGISPGLDFNFTQYTQNLSKKNKSNDFKILCKKATFLLNAGAHEIALLFDDLPNNFYKKFDRVVSEGRTHAFLTNDLSKKLNKNIFVVPRIYADQLIIEDKTYLFDFGKIINKNTTTFYCGKNIVSKTIDNKALLKISKLIPTNIIIWDNFYSNDYCPRKLFIGPLIGRSNIQNIMINPTGLIETDLLILDIVKATKKSKNPKLDWENVLKKHKVPIAFFNLSNYFLKPAFGENPNLEKIYITNKNIESLESLLWKWKSPLSREWYPFLLGLKHDLQLFKRDLSSERIIKTQTCALSNYILNDGEII
ncbi:protein O-GlcNAcase [Alphaproteobacteria bacterium]|nr:protein O-GlcNAcase [Alphaproteobacteria bacterium]